MITLIVIMLSVVVTNAFAMDVEIRDAKNVTNVENRRGGVVNIDNRTQVDARTSETVIEAENATVIENQRGAEVEINN